MSNNKVNFKMKNEKIDEFKSMISNLTKINNTIKMKLNNNNLMFYCIDTAGEGSNVGHATALAVKSYTFTPDYFMEIEQYDDVSDYDDNVDSENHVIIDWIIRNGNILNKKLKFFNTSKESEIKGVFNLRELSNSEALYNRSVIMSDGKFKFSITGDEPHVIRDMSIDQLNSILKPELSEVSFEIPTVEFESARSASNIEPEDVITIYIKSGKIYFKQSSWELFVGKVDDYTEVKKISFNKKYLKSILPKVDTVRFTVYPTFILFQESNQKIMISYEQKF